MIQLDNVVCRFGALTAVDRLSLTVAAGEIFGLVGPDGAGKTSIIRLLCGLLRPNAGSVRLLDSAAAAAVREHIGYLPQRFSLYGDLSVIENIRFIGALYGASRRQIEERGREILAFTNLLPFKDRLADNLSGGMKQKLALAAALLHRPKLFLLDEPTTGVDPVSRREFWQLLYRLNQEGMTIFVSTPYMDEAELCSRLAFINQGQIAACGSPQQLKQAYPYKLLELQAPGRQVKHALAAAPLREINVFGSKYHLAVSDSATAAEAVRAALAAAEIPLLALREIPPGLEDVFVNLAAQREE
ncbi:MAG: ABC transporter ATP-binding protein [Sporomusaceae bacterium]|nr:ABC transporter ATP-binding protein [Sporomusaceae bacterium]